MGNSLPRLVWPTVASSAAVETPDPSEYELLLPTATPAWTRLARPPPRTRSPVSPSWQAPSATELQVHRLRLRPIPTSTTSLPSTADVSSSSRVLLLEPRSPRSFPTRSPRNRAPVWQAKELETARQRLRPVPRRLDADTLRTCLLLAKTSPSSGRPRLTTSLQSVSRSAKGMKEVSDRLTLPDWLKLRLESLREEVRSDASWNDHP